ncbi:ComF family protein [Novosphingobium sp. BL-8H]|uniref:ComF family protein n=1 Tax=Novosphingobium sp. BL-8H TaxID=3127640 RepID=UPI0037583F11
MSLAAAFAPVIDLVYPPRCPLCGAAIAAQIGLCPKCWDTLAIPGDPSCATCSRPFAEDIPDGLICAPCMAQPPRHDGIAAATLYNATSRKLILALKHGNRLALAGMMGRFMAARLPQVDEAWLVVPVPLHRWRIWHRGYNQAAELGRTIARLRGARLAVDLLERRKATPSLGGLGRKARQRALSGAITIPTRHRQRVQGARIVLVDDVLTSGATSEACVSALKRGGAEQVVIACFARVLDEALDSV